MKKLFVIAAAMIMIFSFAACGDGSKDASQSMTADVFNGISEKNGMHMDVEMESDGQDITMNMQVKGDEFYADSSVDGKRGIIIQTGDAVYILDPSSKSGVKYTSSDEDYTEDYQEMMKIDEYADESEYTTGDMKVEGSKYTYEEFSDKNENADTVRFCFDGNDLKYIVIMDENGDVSETMKINALDADIDESLFEVPSGYSISSM